jgi:hypothetical protein
MKHLITNDGPGVYWHDEEKEKDQAKIEEIIKCQDNIFADMIKNTRSYSQCKCVLKKITNTNIFNTSLETIIERFNKKEIW